MSEGAGGGAAPETVLVVDDNEQNRLVVEANLTDAGYRVVQAENGARAVEAFRASPPDLVLLDVLMPEMDGFEACEKIRALPAGPDTPIVFLTALSDGETHERALHSGADDFLNKPIRRTELLIRVRSLLRLRRLTREVKQNYEVIREQNEALLRAQAQKEQLTALVVHDLKSPLAGMMLNAKFLSRTAGLDADGKVAAQHILSAGMTMQRLVMNLLDISRSEDGALVPNRTQVDLGRLISEVCGLLRPRAEDARQKLETRVDLCDAVVHVDADLVRRVLENLVDNALRYTPTGGAVTVEAREAEPGGAVELRVRDEGSGIPPAQRARIFEKYVQLEGVDPHSARTGRGLGLVFCRLAVEVHGGRVWVEDNAPRGTVFAILLPREAPADGAAGAGAGEKSAAKEGA